MLERTPDRHPPLVAVVVVAWAPGLPVDTERERGIVENGHRRELAVSALRAQGRDVHERLERRSGLPPREDGAVVLARRVVPSADKGEDAPGRRVQRDEDRL